MLRRLPAILLATALLGAAPPELSASSPTPLATTMPSPSGASIAAPVVPVVDMLWGTHIVDRYRYLEDMNDARTKAFFETEGAATRSYLAHLGAAREALGRRISELDRSSVSVGSVMRFANTYFFERQDPHDESASLYTRSATGGSARLLVDPSAEGQGRSHHTLDWVVPSLNAHYVAFGLSAGGSEESILHILNVQSGKRLPESIDRTRFGATGWLPDGKSLFYIRLPRTTAATPITDRERYFRAYVHTVGQSVSKDRPVFGWKLDPKIPLAPDDVPSISTAPDSPYVIAAVQHGVLNELTIYATPITSLATHGHIPWKKIADVDDGVTAFDVSHSTMYLLSHRDASTYRVLSINLAHPNQGTRTVVPASHAVIQQIGVAKDALYLRLLDGGIGRVAHVPLGGAIENPLDSTLDLPYDGNVTSIVTDPRVVGVTLGLTGWTHSLLWYNTDADGVLSDTHLKPLSPIDASPYTSVEVTAPSADGTRIPLSIVMKKGTVLDGTHPTYLEGYGAYGVTLAPYFSTTRIAWLERGGIYAVAHVRGGGEFGEAWHHAAMRANKERSIDDFIACAHYLINEGYTAPQYLAGEGTSAGGIVIGGAITRAPHLFAAALDVVGVSDALRSEFSANGPSNIPEFGTIKVKREFETLFNIDAYQQVKDGVAYPAVMLITGLHDPRVPSWELGKFAARLQAATSSGKPILLRIDKDAGHGFLAASRTQSEQLLTDEYAFLLAQMDLL